MRILIDLQACQTGSKYRGVGRYVFSLIEHLIPKLLAADHTVVVLISKLLDDEENSDIATFITKKFDKSVEIEWFDAIGPVEARTSENAWRLRASEVLRETKIKNLNVDLVYITSLLPEGWSEEYVCSVGHIDTNAKIIATHYDLIPIIMPEQYLVEPGYREHYTKKIEWLTKSDKLLCISEYTKQEAGQLLGISESKMVNISSAVGDDFLDFKTRENTPDNDIILQRFNLERDKFFLYAPGGFDYRKNLNNLLEAYGSLPTEIQKAYPLVISSKLFEGMSEAWRWKAGECGLPEDCFIMTDYVSDDELRTLYSACHTYVFPSLYEGFGLPVLEAMACGAAVIASEATSIPEAVGDFEEALFDPHSVAQIKDRLLSVVGDAEFHRELKLHGKERVKAFSWDKTADMAFDAIAALTPASTNGFVSNSIPTVDEAITLVHTLAQSSGSPADEFNFKKLYNLLWEDSK